MRTLFLKALFSLAVLIAVPILGFGNQAQAGVIIVPTHPETIEATTLDSDSLWGDLFADGRDILADLVQSVTEVVFGAPSEGMPFGRLFGYAHRFMFAVSCPGSPGSSGGSLTVGHERLAQTFCLEDLPVATSDAASAYFINVSIRLIDSHLSTLFRPPR